MVSAWCDKKRLFVWFFFLVMGKKDTYSADVNIGRKHTDLVMCSYNFFSKI